MGARFEGHVAGGAPGVTTRRLQGQHLRVGLTGPLVKSLAQHAIAADEDTTYPRIGMGGPGAAFGKAQRACHPGMVG